MEGAEGGWTPPSDVSPTEKHADVTRVKTKEEIRSDNQKRLYEFITLSVSSMFYS